MLNKSLELVVTVLISVLISTSLIFFYGISHKKEIVTINISKVIEDFSKKVALLHGSEKEKDKLSDDFSYSLNQSINAYANKHKKIILVNKAVASTVDDVTKPIEDQVFQTIHLL